MKKITVAGVIIGIFELIVGLFLLLLFIVSAGGVELDRVFSDPKTYFPIICLFTGLLKVGAVIIIWMKNKAGIVFYLIGSLLFSAFLSLLIATDDEFSETAVLLLIMYALIALQFLFVYLMSKAIKTG